MQPMRIFPSIFLMTASLLWSQPVRVIFDTDMGNDVDDALALAALHAFQTRGEAEILAVTITKDNRWAPVFVDLLNTFYGRPNIPIGIVKGGKTPDDGNYTRPTSGLSSYPRRLTPESSVPDAVLVLRKTLAAQPDTSVVIIQVGFSTNLARLLDSGPDELSPLPGRELVARKVRMLSAMAGNFRPDGKPEYNIKIDIPSAAKLFREWPGSIVVSGFEIGETIRYSARNMSTDFGYTEHHPLTDAYRAYKPMPYDEPLWDPTAALYAVRPDDGYFTLSAPGLISVDAEGRTNFTVSEHGKQRYLIVDDAQRARVREAISILISEPPARVCCTVGGSNVRL